MQVKEIVGIDFSKGTFDAVIQTSGKHQAFPNTSCGFKQFVKWLQHEIGQDLSFVLIVLEHTGIYSFLFEKFLHKKGIPFSKVAAIKIKRSSGLVRGKTDKADAKMIARYADQNFKELKEKMPSRESVLRLKNLISLRDKLVRDRAGYFVRMKEQKQFLALSSSDILLQAQQAIIKTFDKEIGKVEKEIKTTITSDSVIQQTFELLTSIKGVGLVVASYMIAFTENFTSFDSWRQFACYTGIAPFPYSSGTSIKAKARVSQYANKKLKSLLHLSASTAIQFNPEMKAYYERRLENGKSKMSTLNVVRNKLVARMFAVVNRKSEYQSDWLKAA